METAVDNIPTQRADGLETLRQILGIRMRRSIKIMSDLFRRELEKNLYDGTLIQGKAGLHLKSYEYKIPCRSSRRH